MTDKDTEKTFIGLTKPNYQSRVWPTTQCMRRLGNAYTASVWGALASLVDSVEPETLKGKRVGLFSYGSGLAASFFTIRVEGSTKAIKETLKLNERLASMEVRPCEEYVKALHVRFHSSSARLPILHGMAQLREEKNNKKDYSPDGSLDDLFPGTYYLVKCDEKFRRTYAVKE